jgi:3'-phosphoadenosine 5'-phosphosulfate sulfotransferase (PAPS reductase)/FAD synthetase
MSVLTDAGCFKGTLTQFDKRELFNLLLCKKRMRKLNIPEQDPEEIIQHLVDEYSATLNIGWSGGKCSTVVLKMALKYFPKIPVVYANTLVEYPENLSFVRQITKDWNLNLTELLPVDDEGNRTNFFKIKAIHGWPKMRKTGSQLKAMGLKGVAAQEYRRPYCCLYCKELPEEIYYKTHNITANISGIRAGESRRRSINLIGGKGQVYQIQTGMVKAHPIALWTRQQVNAFLEKNNIPENLVYRSQNRNGCMWCSAFKGCKEALIRYSLWRFNDLRLLDFVLNDMFRKKRKTEVMLTWCKEQPTHVLTCDKSRST